MLTMRVTPKISDSPAPTKNRLDAAASPLSAWNATASRVIGAKRASSPSPLVGEGRGGGSGGCGDAVPPLPTPTPDPSPQGGGETGWVGSSPNPHSERNSLP